MSEHSYVLSIHHVRWSKHFSVIVDVKSILLKYEIPKLSAFFFFFYKKLAAKRFFQNTVEMFQNQIVVDRIACKTRT